MSSPNPNATELSQLLVQFNSNAAGVNTRTSLLNGFEHNDEIHKWSIHSGGTINCYGYSPHPFSSYLNFLKTLKQRQEQGKGKPVFISITGTGSEVNLMLRQLNDRKEELTSEKYPLFVELNLSCPNIPNKPPLAYDPKGIASFLEQTLLQTGEFKKKLKVGVKLAPYLYDHQFNEIAKVLNNQQHLDFVTSINTVGSGLVLDSSSHTPLMSSATYGGLGGTNIHHIALGNVRKLRGLLKPSIDLIGVGGVSDGESLFSMILSGANLVQVASQFLIEGETCFQRLHSELSDLMGEKGYSNLSQLKA